MNIEHNSIDYGIYIDRKNAFVISLDHIIYEELMEEEDIENQGNLPRSTKVDKQQTHLQNDRNEQLKKFCKSIITKIIDARSLLIFGPSESKYELQKEIRESKSLKNIKEELIVADFMEKDAAIRFVRDHFSQIIVGQQVFAARMKDK